jgi:hypothetical protein
VEQILRDALDVLIPEVERTSGLVLNVVDQAQLEPPGPKWVMLRNEVGSGLGISVAEGDSPAQRLAHLADQIQEWVTEELWRLGLPATWPVCPFHPNTHPLEALVVDNHAVWCCLKDGEVVARVGEIGRMTG